MRNKSNKTRIKNVVKQVRLAGASNDPENAAQTMCTSQSVIDKAAKKGVIHKRAAARKISRLSKLINKLGD